MQERENIYQSILSRMSAIPVDYLQQVDDYLQELITKIEVEKESNRQRILHLAGSWSDMDDGDFTDYLDATKNTSIVEDQMLKA